MNIESLPSVRGPPKPPDIVARGLQPDPMHSHTLGLPVSTGNYSTYYTSPAASALYRMNGLIGILTFAIPFLSFIGPDSHLRTSSTFLVNFTYCM